MNKLFLISTFFLSISCMEIVRKENPEENLLYIEKVSYIDREQFNKHLQGLSNEFKPVRECFEILQYQIDNSYKLLTKLDNLLINSSLLDINEKEEFKSFEQGFININTYSNLICFDKNIKELMKDEKNKFIRVCLTHLNEKINFLINSFKNIYTDLKYLKTTLPTSDLFKIAKPTIDKNNTNFSEYIYKLLKQNSNISECLNFLSSQIDEMIFNINGYQAIVKGAKIDWIKI